MKRNVDRLFAIGSFYHCSFYTFEWDERHALTDSGEHASNNYLRSRDLSTTIGHEFRGPVVYSISCNRFSAIAYQKSTASCIPHSADIRYFEMFRRIFDNVKLLSDFQIFKGIINDKRLVGGDQGNDLTK
jgi:hypothetical protein